MSLRFIIHSGKSKVLMGLFFLMLCAGCGGGSRELPLDRIKTSLKDVPTYSIVLEDMKEEGNFVKTFFHRYRVVSGEQTQTTDWVQVPENYYRKNENFLGMSLISKKDGVENSTAAPPGYDFVGDSRYGRWTQDRHGNSFWEFYGKYALFTSLFGGWYRPIYMNDYNDYTRYRSRSRNTPYFGRNRQYGTSGTIAGTVKPGFYDRQKIRQRAKQQSFSNKVSKRIGRTRTNYRSRAGGLGK